MTSEDDYEAAQGAAEAAHRVDGVEDDSTDPDDGLTPRELAAKYRRKRYV